LNETTEKNMAPNDKTGAERKARYERIGKASAKTIKNMLAGTALGGKLRARGYTWVPENKEPSRKGANRKG
jgi:hypothetical protein